MTRNEATKAAKKLCGLFPPGAASDAKLFFTGIVELFEGYSDRVVERATDIRIGLPSKHQFLPSLAEICAFCTTQVEEERRHLETIERWSKPKLSPPEPDRSKRLSYDEMKAKYGSNWGINNPDKPAQETPEQARERLIELIGEQAYNSLPNAPLPNGMSSIGNLSADAARRLMDDMRPIAEAAE